LVVQEHLEQLAIPVQLVDLVWREILAIKAIQVHRDSKARKVSKDFWDKLDNKDLLDK